MYGLEFNGRRARCPWNTAETRFNLSFERNGRCHCFACGAGGDAIDLTAQLFGLSPLDAAKKLNADFRLGVDEAGKPSPEMIARQRERERIKMERTAQRQYLSQCAEIEREAGQWLEQHDSGGWDAPGFMVALKAYSRANTALEQARAQFGRMVTRDKHGRTHARQSDSEIRGIHGSARTGGKPCGADDAQEQIHQGRQPHDYIL